MSNEKEASPFQESERASRFNFLDLPKKPSQLTKCCRCSFRADPLTLYVAPKGRPTNILQFLLSLKHARFTSCDVLQTELRSPHAYLPSRFFHTFVYSMTIGITLFILFFVYITNGRTDAAPWVIFIVWFVIVFSIFLLHMAKAKTVNLVHWLLKLNYEDSSNDDEETSILAEFGRDGMQIYHSQSWVDSRSHQPDDNPAWYEPIQEDDLSCKFQFGAHKRWSVRFHRGMETYTKHYSHIFTAEMHEKSDSEKLKKQMFAMLWEYDSTALEKAVLQSRKIGLRQSRFLSELLHLNDLTSSSPKSEKYVEDIMQKSKTLPYKNKRHPDRRNLRSESDPIGIPCLANRVTSTNSLDTPDLPYTPEMKRFSRYHSESSIPAFTPEETCDSPEAPRKQRLLTITSYPSESSLHDTSPLAMNMNTHTEHEELDVDSNSEIKYRIHCARSESTIDHADVPFSLDTLRKLSMRSQDEFSETNLPVVSPMFDHRTISLTPSVGKGQKGDAVEHVLEMNQTLDEMSNSPLSPVMREFEHVVDPFGYNARNKNCQTFVRDIWIMFDYKFKTIFQKRMHYRARYGWYTISRVLVAAAFYLVLFICDGYIHFTVAVCALTWLTVSGDGTRIIGWRLKNYVDELTATEWFLCGVLRIYSHDTPAYEKANSETENFPVDHDVESYVFGMRIHWSLFYFAMWVVQFLIVLHKMSTILIPLFIMCRTFHDVC